MRRGVCLLSRVRPSANKSMLLGAFGLLGVREDLLGRRKGRLGTVRGFATSEVGCHQVRGGNTGSREGGL